MYFFIYLFIFLLASIKPCRHTLPVVYHQPWNRPESQIFTPVQHLRKGISNFITSSPLTIQLPLSTYTGFMGCVLLHASVHEFLHCALMTTWITWIPCGYCDAVLSAPCLRPPHGSISSVCLRNETRPDQRKFEWILRQSEDRQPSGRVTAWLDFPLSGAIPL